MAYATPDQLARAMSITATPTNTDRLQACLDAAAAEIDHDIDWPTVEPPEVLDPASDGYALAQQVNIVRGIEWFKANESAFGVIGFDQTGALQAPRDGFARHRYELTPLKRQWGIA